ncbi:MAG: PHP domain-containing protein [Clostridia bacterium]|nr:PHP domain-containing protein [Clostridia bacterium]
MIVADLHLHTKNSKDGKQTLDQIIQSAKNKGLLQIGISDHGFAHVTNGTTKKKQIALMEEIKEKTCDQLQILAGIEANLTSLDGTIDVSQQFAEKLDYVNLGYHKTTMPKGFLDFCLLNLPGSLKWKKFSQSMVDKYTKAFVKALKRGYVNVLVHPCYCLPLDMTEIGKVAIDYNVLLELNGKRINMTDDQIVKLYQMGAKFIINSDAHTLDRVGDFSRGLQTAQRLGILTSVVNNDKKVEFV